MKKVYIRPIVESATVKIESSCLTSMSVSGEKGGDWKGDSKWDFEDDQQFDW